MSAKATPVPPGKLALLRGFRGGSSRNETEIINITFDFKGLFQIAK
jgi:hypothetical protein